MGLDILDAIGRIAPILTQISSAAGKAQDTNAIIGNNSAANRPGIVSKNLSNARLASMMDGYKTPTLKWGGPGSVARGGAMPTYEGGPAPQSATVSDLEKEVQQDALAQAKNNYGIKDPSASSAGSTAAGAVGTASSILGALGKLGLGGGGTPSSGSGSAGGPGSPGTFGQAPTAANPGGNYGNGPSNVNTPFGISDQGGPTDVRAIGPDAIEMLRRMGIGIGASATEPMTGNPYI